MIATTGPMPCCCPTPLLPHGLRTGDRPETGFVEALSPKIAASPDRLQAGTDRIVVVGGAPRTLDLLRLATIRSDDVVLVAEALDAATRRFVDHFAIDYRPGPAYGPDVEGAAAVLVAIGDVARENALVRSVRRLNIPVHVDARPLLSDFTMLELVERHPASIAGRDGNAGQRVRTG